MPDTGTVIEVTNPATGEIAGRVTASSREDVARAVAAARDAQPTWAATPVERRAKVLIRFHDLLKARAVEILDVIQAETGKARRDALTEVATVMGQARYYAYHGPRHIADSQRAGAVPMTRARVEYRPWGVCGFITPWNYPFLLGIGDALAALLAGNSVVIKPAERTPMSVELALDLLQEAGLPAGVASAVHGAGSEVGDELIDHVDYLAFTGGTTTGRYIGRRCGEALVPCSLELGGKNAMIVTDSANIRQAVIGILNGAFSNAGQSCITTERCYVVDSVADELLEQLGEATDAMRVGWATDWQSDMGSLITEAHADSVESMVHEALEAGGRLVAGGQRVRNEGPAFIRPTVLRDVPADAAPSRDEIFGPVVAVTPVRSIADAIDAANDTEYGLNASIWSGSRSEARSIARDVSAGSVNINSTLLIFNSFDAPMGGLRASGLGRRHGVEGIRRFCAAVTVTESPRFKGGYDSLQRLATTPRRAGMLLGLIGMIRRIPGLR